MKDLIRMMSIAIHRLKGEDGQDLVEYALVVALIAFAAVAGMQALAGDINSAFVSIGNDLTGAIQ